MNENILALEPKRLWKNFRELTLIPHPSKHEEKITKMLLEFGKRFADESIQDETGNIIWRKKATAGMENRKGIILQAHCDMVPQKDNNKVHDFLTDPITTVVKDGYVMADETTLGGDDGIGVAAIMSIFEDDTIAHGPIEGLITVDEETGLTGAEGLKPGVLQGQILVNLDSEEHGIFYIGCAGGVNIYISKQLDLMPVDATYKPMVLKTEGFMGGHSGGDIHKNRPNANKILFRFINEIAGKIDFKLGSAEGGNMHNAIPREASAMIAVKNSDVAKLQEAVAKFQDIISGEYGKSDPNGKISVEDGQLCSEGYLTDGSMRTANYMVNTVLSGVFAMSAEMPGLVETSSNLSVMQIKNGKITLQCFQRSSVQSQNDYVKNLTKLQMEFCGATVEFDGEYPGWKPNPDSEIVELSKNIFKTQFNEEPVITAIHAGLECGLIIGKYPGMDVISLGPTMFGVHTPTEKIEIESCGKFMTLLEEIIKNAPSR